MQHNQDSQRITQRVIRFVMLAFIVLLVACTQTLPSAAVAPCAGSAAPACTFVVTSAADSGPGSLRAIISTPYTAGSTIRFDAALATGPILLETPLFIHQTVTIDGGSGVVLDAQRKSRILTVGAGASVVLMHLTLSHGAAISGGAFENNGSVVLSGVSVRANAAAIGAAIDNWGALLLVNSTLSDNDATASANDPFTGTILANHPAATLQLLHATVIDNRATGSTLRSTGALILRNTVLTQTTGSAAATVFCDALNPQVDHSITPDGSCGTQRAVTTLLTAANGTTAQYWYNPSPGSVLIDAASAAGCGDTAVAGVDQRGQPRTQPCDIGAIEEDSPVAAHTATVDTAGRRGTRVIPLPKTTTTTQPRMSMTARLRSTATIRATKAPQELTVVTSHTPAATWTHEATAAAPATHTAVVLLTATPFVEATQPPTMTRTVKTTRRPTAQPTEGILPTHTAIPTEAIAPSRTPVSTEIILPTKTVTPFPTDIILPTRTKTLFPTEPVAPTRTPVT